MTEFQFIEPGTLIELEEDVMVAAGVNGCWSLQSAANPERVRDTDVVIPSGTVIQIGSYRNNARRGRGCVVSLLIVYSPDRRFMPKSRGGTGRRVTIHPKVSVFNAIGFKGKVVV